MPAWVHSLKSVLAEEKATVDRVVLTHWHHDHTSGVSDVQRLYPKATVFKNQPGDGQSDITNGQVFNTDGATLRAFHCPGHTTDHMALILEEENAMFTGDNVLGQGTAVFEDYAAYMTSLDKMQHEFTGRAYPGHGPVIEDGKSKIQEYIRHRWEREEQVLAVLARDNEGGGGNWKSMNIVRVIYKGYPENLHAPAEAGLLKILTKLENEGKVSRDHDGWRLGSKASL